MNKKPYLCIVKNGTGGSVERLDYGVMVTQQILVLFFQVRVLVVQLESRMRILLRLFFALIRNEKLDKVKSWFSRNLYSAFKGYNEIPSIRQVN